LLNPTEVLQLKLNCTIHVIYAWVSLNKDSISSRFRSPVVYPPPNEPLDHCSVGLVRDVTSAFHANCHAGTMRAAREKNVCYAKKLNL